MLNRSVITGRLTKDPVIRNTEGENRLALFTLAVDRNYRDENGDKRADFIQVSAWNALSEVCEKHLRKGDLCTVEGSIRTGSYKKEGSMVYTTRVNADSVFLLPGGGRDKNREESPRELPEGFEEITQELPF